MFNTLKEEGKSIYQFGINPKIDIQIPNWHNIFILYKDFISYDPWKKEINSFSGKIPENYLIKIDKQISDNINTFCSNCNKTSFPEMSLYFINNWKKIRMFWSLNHTSKNFTLPLWNWINEKFLSLPMTSNYLEEISKIDVLKEKGILYPYDIERTGIQWKE